jgi:hypothetical protein
MLMLSVAPNIQDPRRRLTNCPPTDVALSTPLAKFTAALDAFCPKTELGDL